MRFLIVESGKISNIISADTTFATMHNFKPYYEGASIGDSYNPVTMEGLLQKAKEIEADSTTLAEAVAGLMYEADKKSIGG